MKTPKVSVLVPTDRPWLKGWIRWVIEQQTYRNIEGFIVNGHDMTIGQKRNACLEDCEGDYVVWFDDDDWQHPRKIETLVAAVADGVKVAGFDNGYFFRPADYHVKGYRAKTVLPPASCIIETRLARSIRFDETLKVGEDTRWMERVLQSAGPLVRRLHHEAPHALWMRHGQNTSPDREEGWAPLTQALADLLPEGWNRYLGVFALADRPAVG